MTKKSVAFIIVLILISIALAVYIGHGTFFFARLNQSSSSELLDESGEPVIVQVGAIQDRSLDEISGIDASRRYPDTFWVHNDSGNPAEAYLISMTGETLARIRLPGVTNVDWEDICVFEFGGSSYVCLADVGDNRGRRSTYQLYIFAEPDLQTDPDTGAVLANANPQRVAADVRKFEFRYEAGSKNCESIAYDSSRRSFLLVEKKLDRETPESPLGIFRLQHDENLKLKSSVAKRIAKTEDYSATAMAISADCKQLVIGNYNSARWWRRMAAMTWAQQLARDPGRLLPLPLQRQGEALCFSADGESVFVVSEYARQPIWKINIEPALEAAEKEKD